MLKRHEDWMNGVTNKIYKSIVLNCKLGVSVVKIHVVAAVEGRDQGSGEKIVTKLQT